MSWFQIPGYSKSETLTVNSGVTFAFTPELFWENNLQANTVEETGRLLSRVRWRYLPGSDLFLVYQENVSYSGPWTSEDRRVVFKVNYWWDAVF